MLSNSVRVSITIPTLGRTDSLLRCVRSVVPQVSEEDEIIIVDGASRTDKDRDILGLSQMCV